jgi:2,4-diketo-3-deoxy-L-fuconate hydrolase
LQGWRGEGFTVYAPVAVGRALMPGGTVEPVVVYRGRVYSLASWGYDNIRDLLVEVQPEEAIKLAENVARSDRGLPLPAVRLAAPVDKPEKVICIGVNYQAHARESGIEVPPAPNLFVKTPNSIVGPGDPIIIHSRGLKVDAEVELAAVIGIPARSLEPHEALEAVWGFTVFNDFTSRYEQRELGISQWWRAKSHDTYAPIGPVIVPRTVLEWRKLRLWLVVDGVVVREGNTSDMIYGVDALVSWASIATLLVPGDIIATGTPAGTGEGGKPPKTPTDGSRVEACIENIGCVENTVVLDENLKV